MSFTGDGNSLGVLYLGYAYDPTSDNNKGAQTQLLIWDFDSGLVKESFYDFDYPNPIAFAYSPDGSKFFTASFDGSIRLHDAETTDVTVSRNFYTSRGQASLSPDGSMVRCHSGIILRFGIQNAAAGSKLYL